MKYTPHTSQDVKEMLNELSLNSLEELYNGLESFFASEIPLPKGKSQQDVERKLKAYANKNTVFNTIFRGAGAYRHYIPSLVKSLSAREEFVTAYTPYQAEMSQGILQVIFEYQTMIARLTGMDVSNASHYDGSTALADGLLMCAERKKNKVLLSKGINPRTLAVVKTYLQPQNIEIEYIELTADGKTDISDLRNKLTSDVFAVAVAQPNYFGVIEDAKKIGELVQEAQTHFVMSVEPISQGILPSAGECYADVAVGEGQPLGMPLSFGGPYLGFLATKEKLMRRLVGRVVGQTKDADGKVAYVLTLQAREQHIRREKASSSICSNQAYCALLATLYLATVGKNGLITVAENCVTMAHRLCTALERIGYKRKFASEFCNEFVTISENARKEMQLLEENGILGGLALSDTEILWCATEVNTDEEIAKVVELLSEVDR